MDDFLHNLRSGKLKQPERQRRDFTDYKGPQRRQGNERRRPDFYTKVTNENFALLKDSLDVLAESQKRIADTMVDRTQNQTRIVHALEAIATMMARHLGCEALLALHQEAVPENPVEMESETVETVAPPEAEQNPTDVTGEGGQPLGEDPSGRMNLIDTLRGEGSSWEKIARCLDEQNIPTVSGKGKWRGPAVKKYWEAHHQTAGS